MIANIDYVLSWKSKGLSAETNKPPTTSDDSLTPSLSYKNESKILWKLFTTTKNLIHSWKSNKHLHCL